LVVAKWATPLSSATTSSSQTLLRPPLLTRPTPLQSSPRCRSTTLLSIATMPNTYPLRRSMSSPILFSLRHRPSRSL
jgi:hypothetical protein